MYKSQTTTNPSKMSFGDLFALGFGSIVGVGWSSTLNNLLKNGGGAVPSIIAFGVATVIFITIAFCFAELTSIYSAAGGVTVYAYCAFGRRTSFIAGWFMCMAYIAILPFESIAISDITGYIFQSMKAGKPLYNIAGESIYLNTVFVGIVFAVVICLSNWRGIRVGVRIQKITMTLLLIGSIICIVLALLRSDVKNLLHPIYAPVADQRHSALLSGVITLLAMTPQYFSGFDTIPQSAEFGETKDLRKAIIGAVVSAGIFYCMVFLSAGLALPWQITIELDRPAMSNLLEVVYGGMLGRLLWYVCIVSTLAGLFSACNGFFLAGTRALYSMAKADLLPKIFKKQNQRYGTPYAAFGLCTIIMLAGPFLGAGVLDIICRLSSIGFVIAWTIACISVLKLHPMELNTPRSYQIPGRRIIPIIASGFCLIMIINSILPIMPGFIGYSGLIALAIWCMLGAIRCCFIKD